LRACSARPRGSACRAHSNNTLPTPLDVHKPRLRLPSHESGQMPATSQRERDQRSRGEVTETAAQPEAGRCLAAATCGEITQAGYDADRPIKLETDSVVPRATKAARSARLFFTRRRTIHCRMSSFVSSAVCRECCLPLRGPAAPERPAPGAARAPTLHTTSGVPRVRFDVTSTIGRAQTAACVWRQRERQTRE